MNTYYVFLLYIIYLHNHIVHSLMYIHQYAPNWEACPAEAAHKYAEVQSFNKSEPGLNKVQM